MTPDKLKEIVTETNEELERQAVAEARKLVAHIAKCNQQIIQLKDSIADAQKSLRELQVTQLDPVSILGA